MNKKGFTLTEMIAVIVIIGLLILIAIPISKRMIVNIQQERVNNKQKVVEKAMVAYAETDNHNYKCVMMDLNQVIQNGYLKDGDLGTKYNDKSKKWYYYDGAIEESTPTDGTVCNNLSNSEVIDGEIGDEYLAVLVPTSGSFTVEIEKDSSDTGGNWPTSPSDIGNNWTSITITEYNNSSGSSNSIVKTVTCNDVTTCTLEGVTPDNYVKYSAVATGRSIVSGAQSSGSMYKMTSSDYTQKIVFKASTDFVLTISRDAASSNISDKWPTSASDVGKGYVEITIRETSTFNDQHQSYNTVKQVTCNDVTRCVLQNVKPGNYVGYTINMPDEWSEVNETYIWYRVERVQSGVERNYVYKYVELEDFTVNLARSTTYVPSEDELWIGGASFEAHKNDTVAFWTISVWENAKYRYQSRNVDDYVLNSSVKQQVYCKNTSSCTIKAKPGDNIRYSVSSMYYRDADDNVYDQDFIMPAEATTKTAKITLNTETLYYNYTMKGTSKTIDVVSSNSKLAKGVLDVRVGWGPISNGTATISAYYGLSPYKNFVKTGDYGFNSDGLNLAGDFSTGYPGSVFHIYVKFAGSKYNTKVDLQVAVTHLKGVT